MIPNALVTHRVLSFPESEPVGWIDIQHWRSQVDEPWITSDELLRAGDWQRLGAAQGRVEIPANQAVRLRLNGKTSLDFLARLSSNDIQDIIQDLTIRNAGITDSDLYYLRHLTGLRSLDLWGTRVTPEGFHHLGYLHGLEHLAWSNIDSTFDPLHTLQVDLSFLTPLSNLKSLRISAPGLAGAMLRHLRELPALRILRLINFRELDEVGWQHIAELSALRVLTFAGEHVDETALVNLSKLNDLEELDLSTTSYVDGQALHHLRAMHRLKALSLYQVHRGIYEEHLKPLQHLPALEFVGYSGSDTLSDTGLEYLAHIPSLRHLDISGDLQTVPEYTERGLEQLQYVSQLETLNLSFTAARSQGLKVLRMLKHLRELYLSGTELEDNSLEFLKSLEELRILQLNDTDVTDEGLVHLAGLKNLEELHLENTRTTGAGLRALVGLTKLHTLSVGNLLATSGFETESLAVLAKNSIKVLTINNGRSPVGPTIALFPELQNLSLFGMSLSRQDAREIALLPQLRFLHLINGSIDVQGIEHLSTLRNLQILHLDQAKIPERAVSTLGKLQQLEVLSLWDTLITGRELAELRKILPNCQVLGS